MSRSEDIKREIAALNQEQEQIRQQESAQVKPLKSALDMTDDEYKAHKTEFLKNEHEGRFQSSREIYVGTKNCFDMTPEEFAAEKQRFCNSRV